MAIATPAGIWDAIADGAERETVWAPALRPPAERERVPVFSPLADKRFALGLETIYEGYLLHYGRPRLFAPADRDGRILLGDHLYAQGLVRIAEPNDVAAVADLAELLSVCAELRAESGGEPVPDGVAWAATVALLGKRDARLDAARAKVRQVRSADGLARLADEAGGERAALALSLHADRVHDPSPPTIRTR